MTASRYVVVALLVAASVSARPPQKPQCKATDPDRKMTTALVQAIVHFDSVAKAQGVARARAAAARTNNPLIRTNEAGEFQLYLSMNDMSPAAQAAVERLGARIVRVAPDLKLIECWVPPDRVRAVAAEKAVRFVRPVGRPRVRIGHAMTQGDAILGANQVRALGFDGTGVKVGVVSDDVDHLAAAQASGDLPPRVTVLPGKPGFGDEGTAMLEIVHDIAPGAALYFGSGDASSLAMRNMILALADSGCSVIVDDIGWEDQPFFQDGFLAQAADQVAARGVVYCSAAGNDAEDHYQEEYHAVSASNAWHAWNLTSDSTMGIIVDPGQTLAVVLQWDDPFGASGNDYDMYLTADPFLSIVIASSTDQQSGTQDPIEGLAWTNVSSQPIEVFLGVTLFRGVPRTLGLFFTNDAALQYIVPSGSIWGQPAANGAIAVGAINASQPGQNTIAPYSSQGPASIVFPQAQQRLKPDVIGIDGVSISGAGGFENPFFGTSAAAPHIAAVAALLRQAHPTWSASTVRQALTSTALDLGTPGPDEVYGYGLVRALAAVNAQVGIAEAPQPAAFSLAQNTPNPFNPSTVIRFSVPEAGAAQLVVYGMTGQIVRVLVDGPTGAGTHEVTWDGHDALGRGVASGVYVARLVYTPGAGDRIVGPAHEPAPFGRAAPLVRRMVLVR